MQQIKTASGWRKWLIGALAGVGLSGCASSAEKHWAQNLARGITESQTSALSDSLGVRTLQKFTNDVNFINSAVEKDTLTTLEELEAALEKSKACMSTLNSVKEFETPESQSTLLIVKHCEAEIEKKLAYFLHAEDAYNKLVKNLTKADDFFLTLQSIESFFNDVKKSAPLGHSSWFGQFFETTKQTTLFLKVKNSASKTFESHSAALRDDPSQYQTIKQYWEQILKLCTIIEFLNDLKLIGFSNVTQFRNTSVAHALIDLKEAYVSQLSSASQKLVDKIEKGKINNSSEIDSVFDNLNRLVVSAQHTIPDSTATLTRLQANTDTAQVKLKNRMNTDKIVAESDSSFVNCVKRAGLAKRTYGHHLVKNGIDIDGVVTKKLRQLFDVDKAILNRTKDYDAVVRKYRQLAELLREEGFNIPAEAASKVADDNENGGKGRK